MKAMILAAGHGKRMRPLTNETPKPLLEVGDKPLIIWHIENLIATGIKEIVINMGWKGWKLPERLGDGSQWGIRIYYSDEQDTGALETAGGIQKALPLLGGEPFIVVNGDIWCHYDYRNLTLRHNDQAHLLLVNNPEHNPAGDFAIKNGRVSTTGEVKYTFSGIGCYHPELFKNLQPGKAALAPLLRKAMEEQLVGGEVYQGDWRDIGTPERLALLDQELKSKLNR